MSHNGITKMEGLSTLVNLRVLDVASNKLTEINEISNLTRCEKRKPCIIHPCRFVTFLNSPGYLGSRLEDLWLNDNQIRTLDKLDEAVAGFRENLTTIYLERNPCVCILTL